MLSCYLLVFLCIAADLISSATEGFRGKRWHRTFAAAAAAVTAAAAIFTAAAVRSLLFLFFIIRVKLVVRFRLFGLSKWRRPLLHLRTHERNRFGRVSGNSYCHFDTFKNFYLSISISIFLYPCPAQYNNVYLHIYFFIYPYIYLDLSISISISLSIQADSSPVQWPPRSSQTGRGRRPASLRARGTRRP